MPYFCEECDTRRIGRRDPVKQAGANRREDGLSAYRDFGVRLLLDQILSDISLIDVHHPRYNVCHKIVLLLLLAHWLGQNISLRDFSENLVHPNAFMPSVASGRYTRLEDISSRPSDEGF